MDTQCSRGANPGLQDGTALRLRGELESYLRPLWSKAATSLDRSLVFLLLRFDGVLTMQSVGDAHEIVLALARQFAEVTQQLIS